MASLRFGSSAAIPPARYSLIQWCTALVLTPSSAAACFCCMPDRHSSTARRRVPNGMGGLGTTSAYRGSACSHRSRHCLVGYPRCSTTCFVDIDVVKYSSTARSRSSRLNTATILPLSLQENVRSPVPRQDVQCDQHLPPTRRIRQNRPPSQNDSNKNAPRACMKLGVHS